MSTFIILLVVLFVWMIYEFWRAPLMKENEDGSFTTIRPAKKIKDLWRRRF